MIETNSLRESGKSMLAVQHDDDDDILKSIRKCIVFLKFCHNENHELDSIQNAPICSLQKLHALES